MWTRRAGCSMCLKTGRNKPQRSQRPQSAQEDGRRSLLVFQLILQEKDVPRFDRIPVRRASLPSLCALCGGNCLAVFPRSHAVRRTVPVSPAAARPAQRVPASAALRLSAPQRPQDPAPGAIRPSRCRRHRTSPQAPAVAVSEVRHTHDSIRVPTARTPSHPHQRVPQNSLQRASQTPRETGDWLRDDARYRGRNFRRNATSRPIRPGIMAVNLRPPNSKREFWSSGRTCPQSPECWRRAEGAVTYQPGAERSGAPGRPSKDRRAPCVTRSLSHCVILPNRRTPHPSLRNNLEKQGRSRRFSNRP